MHLCETQRAAEGRGEMGLIGAGEIAIGSRPCDRRECR